MGGDLVTAGRAVTLSSLGITGVLTLDSLSYNVGTTTFSGAPPTIPGLPYQALTVNGTASIGSQLTITGDLTVGPSGQLSIGGNLLTVPGNVDAGNTIIGSGTIIMTGIGVSLRGTLPNLTVDPTADVLVDGTVRVTGTADIFGHLSFGPPDGMTDVMSVAGSMNFDGPQLDMHEDLDTLYAYTGIGACNTPSSTSLGGVIATPDFWEDCSGFQASGTHKLLMNGTGSNTLALWQGGNLQNLEVTGSNSLQPESDLVVEGNLVVSESGNLDVGSNTITVTGKLGTVESGVLTMQSLGVLDVKGNATFNGGGLSGLLSDGILRVAGNFTQVENGAPGGTFEATANHIVELDGTAQQTLHFDTPSPTGASQFNDLRIVNNSAGGVVFTSDVFVVRNLLTPLDTTTQRLFGQGYTLTARGLNAQSIVFDDLPISIDVAGLSTALEF